MVQAWQHIHWLLAHVNYCDDIAGSLSPSITDVSRDDQPKITASQSVLHSRPGVLLVVPRDFQRLPLMPLSTVFAWHVACSTRLQRIVTGAVPNRVDATQPVCNLRKLHTGYA